MIKNGCIKYRNDGDNISNMRRNIPLMVCDNDIPVAARSVDRSAVVEKPVNCRNFDLVDNFVGASSPLFFSLEDGEEEDVVELYKIDVALFLYCIDCSWN